MRKNAVVLALMAFAFSSAATLLADGDDDRHSDDKRSDDESRIKRGFELAPVPLNFRGKNRAKVGLGSYIVNAQGGCNDCHTNPPFAPGGDPYVGEPRVINAANYLAGGVAFGPFVSRNLTPDASGKPGGLTLRQFIHVMRTGEDIDKDPPHVPSYDHDILQVMPWPVYGQMTDGDLRAVYEYLRAIPHADPLP